MSDNLFALRKQVQGFDETKRRVIGCEECCHFCGARCEAGTPCKKEEGGSKHRTILHRPMAFKGAFIHEFVEINGQTVKQKILQGDHCLSEFNLQSSEWPDSSIIKEDSFETLERLNSSVQTQGINLVLEWKTADDLDLHAKCACDDDSWTDTPFNIACVDCHMERDVDMRTGRAGRDAIEHIYFAKPRELIGKEIGAYVENHLPVVVED